MYVPIQKDHESCCPNCGCVLAIIDEDKNKIIEKPTISLPVDILILGSALNNNASTHLQRTPQAIYEERSLRKLLDITREFGLPERFAVETFNQMKKKNRGFRSQIEPIKQLIKILSKDENYLYIYKMRALKARYEKLSNP